MKNNAVILVLVLGLFQIPLDSAHAEKNGFTLESYISQVLGKNDAVRASDQASKGAELRKEEGTLLLAPTLFGSAQFLTDKKETSNPAFSGTKTQGRSYQLGISKLTSFGTEAKLYYDLTGVDITGSSLAFVPMPNYYEAKPVLEVSQSLLKNAFGYGTRAYQESLQAERLITRYTESFKVKMALAEAETTYWRLALAQAVVQVQRDSQKRAAKILEWTEGRTRLQLADRSDYLQAQAAYEGKNLELQTALDDLRAASQAFNSMRGSDSEDITEQLSPPEMQWLENLSAPKTAGARDDLKAAEQVMRLTEANVKYAANAALPDIQVFGSYALTGRAISSSEAMNKSFASDHPTWTVGVKFSASLDVFTSLKVREGYSLESEAAAASYQRKLFDQGRDLSELGKKFSESKRRLSMAKALENAQKNKVEHERTRHTHGRTTTYQVLMFEQDFASSQLARIKIESELLGIFAQLKTYGGAL